MCVKVARVLRGQNFSSNLIVYVHYEHSSNKFLFISRHVSVLGIGELNLYACSCLSMAGPIISLDK